MKSVLSFLVIFCVKCCVSQNQLSDSLYKIAHNYHLGYELEGKHDVYFQKKIEYYYKASIEKDTLNKKAYRMLNFFYIKEVLFFLDQMAEFELNPPKTKKMKQILAEAENKYNEYLEKSKMSQSAYNRIFSEDSPENSAEYIQDPFYMNNKSN